MSKLPAITQVGAFGRFRYGGKELVETWLALESQVFDHDQVFGIDSAEDLIQYGKSRGILTEKEVKMFQDAMKDAR